MKAALVSMPWLAFDRPSIAIATLAAYVREHEPRVELSCWSEHVKVWHLLRDDYEALFEKGLAGELVYLHHLYPERQRQARQALARQVEQLQHSTSMAEQVLRPRAEHEPDLDRALAVTADHLAQLATTLAAGTDLLGLTTSWSQLFASLCLAQAVKAANSAVVTVLGGAAATIAGTSLLQEYPFVDFVVTGEGELRFLHLLRTLLAGGSLMPAASGVLGQVQAAAPGSPGPAPADPASYTVKDLDSLPLPDYDEYHELSEQLSILSVLPIEGSRGCWWDQRSRAPRRDANRGCSFCGANSSSSRRDKSAQRIADEMRVQAVRYENLRFLFTDNLVRATGREQLAAAMQATGASFRFNLELRADIESRSLVALQRAGCSAVQIGIEGLSTPYLRRMNKGTTTIQNLATMRACRELGIYASSNLLLGFPQATAAEVAETVTNIDHYACCYDPLNTSAFCVDRESMVFRNAERLGITGLRTRQHLRQVLPDEVASRLELPWLDHDEQQPVDWTPVLEACQRWRQLHRRLVNESEFQDILHPLFYFDGGVFLEIIDRRAELKTFTLNQLLRDIYRFCMEIRTRSQIIKAFHDRADAQFLEHEVLAPLLAAHLLFREGNRYLALAVAWRPEVAIRRIEEATAAG